MAAPSKRVVHKWINAGSSPARGIKMTIFPQNSIIDNSKPKIVKFGIDPTLSRLHLGHLVPLRVVKNLQLSGHDIHIVLGTLTAQLGDPSGKDSTRPILSQNEVEENSVEIAKQVKNILGENISIHRNFNWFKKMSIGDFLKISSSFTLSNLTSRDAFQLRIKNGNPIAIHELMVPILQGWDSVHLKAEIEIGGQDQLFNFQITRQLQELNNQKPQICILTDIINGTDGRKMSKSFNNCIFLDDSPQDIFGKCMSISDETMLEWIPLLTDIKAGTENRMQLKKDMALDITQQLHGEEKALSALNNFESVIQKKEVPSELTEINSKSLVEAVSVLKGISKTSARNIIKGGGVKVDGVKIQDEINLSEGSVLKVGNRSFAKIV